MKDEELEREQVQEETQAEETVVEATPIVEPVLLRDELEAQRRALMAEKAAFAREKLVALVERELVSRGLAAEFAVYLTGNDEAESLAQIEAFEALFQASLRRELTRRLGSTGAPREPKGQRGYSRESLRRMSAGEINQHWEEISRTLQK
jgi:hypothetical protein